MRKFVSASAPKVKDVEWIRLAMEDYRDSQLPHDEPMKALITGNQKLHNRIWEQKNEQKKSAFSRS